jgi:hypothetical protein
MRTSGPLVCQSGLEISKENLPLRPIAIDQDRHQDAVKLLARRK